MSSQLRRRRVASALALIGLLFAACEERSINHILADPHRYANRDVGIKGTVIESYSVVGRGIYRVDDGTGRLWIVTDRGVPRKGARVAVKGRIKDGYNLGDFGALLRLPDRLGSGLVMVEERHKTQN
ncbi:MAG TPA: hypothetical protein VE398_09605 [Acidobacteriota bacterium]|nr:hypothetical protein [Acidobacteriota bacterium]